MPACPRWAIVVLMSLVGFAAVESAALADDYPARPVRIITDSGAGSAIDASNRILADGLGRVWGRQAVVINQPGAGGSIATRAAATAAPDGYTLLIAALSAFVALPGGADNLPIHVPHDFTPVGYVGGAAMFITAAPRLGVSTLADLIARAKEHPGELAYGSNGPGRLTHLTGELLQSRAGIKLLMIPYAGGTAQVLNDVMGGRIAIAIDAYSGLAGAIQAGNVRALAVASPSRLAQFPDLPSVSETLPGFEAIGWQVLLAPVGTPDALVRTINAGVIKALNDPETRSRLAALNRDDRPLSPEQTLAFIQGEQQKWAPILQQIGGKR